MSSPYWKQFKNFRDSLSLTGIQVEVSDSTLEKLRQNCSGLNVPILGKIAPRNKNELLQIVMAANTYKIPLFPFSGGCNWGFGSKVPTQENCVLLSLENFNRILKVDATHGYAVIEAGVSQRQLYERLKADAPEWFFDVTGSSSQSSIVGNALERGIAYNTQRVNVVSDFEVLTGSGNFLNTGCGQFAENEMTHLYRHGLGPSFEGLFFQSNFGIVTQATITLSRRPEFYDFVSISISDAKQLPDLVTCLGTLLRDGVLQCIPHIFNRERILPVIAPLWKEQLHLSGKKLNDEQIEERLKKLFPGSWTAFMGLSGTKENIRSIRRKIKKALPLGLRPFILSEGQEAILNFLADHLPFATEKSMLFKATRPTRNMVRGIPTDETLQSIAWPLDRTRGRVEAGDLDGLNAGFIYCTPFAALNGVNAQRIIDITEMQAKKFDFIPAISLNLVDHKILEGVLSVHFDKRQPEQVERAKLCIRSMHEEFLNCGFLPYRLDVGSMDLVPQLQSNCAHFWVEMKKIFDPNNIIAPERYAMGSAFGELQSTAIDLGASLDFEASQTL